MEIGDKIMTTGATALTSAKGLGENILDKGKNLYVNIFFQKFLYFNKKNSEMVQNIKHKADDGIKIIYDKSKEVRYFFCFYFNFLLIFFLYIKCLIHLYQIFYGDKNANNNFENDITHEKSNVNRTDNPNPNPNNINNANNNNNLMKPDL